MNPKVSVIIPTYERSNKLRVAIDSVLKQTFSDLEVIVVDDNNPNTNYRIETEKVMKVYEDNEKVKYIKHSVNKNGSAARNTGINNALGDYIAFLDDDDEFYSDKIDKQVKLLESLNESFGLCYTSYVRKKDNKIVVKSNEKREGFLLEEALMRNLFIHAGSNLLIKKSIVKEVGGFDETFKRNQDLEFLVKVLSKYKIAYSDYVGLCVNIHVREYGVDFKVLSQKYIENFSQYINELPLKSKDKVLKMINLQIFRHYIIYERKLNKALNMIKKREVSLIKAVRYMFHLMVRNLRRKSYGFKY